MAEPGTMLVHQRCWHHELREAVARCPECGRFYCRECVTEHEDRLMCAACLKKVAQGPARQRLRLAGLARLGACVGGVWLAWIFFYGCGQALLTMPSTFHEGTVWQALPWDWEED